jgi:hypothetical protein
MLAVFVVAPDDDAGGAAEAEGDGDGDAEEIVGGAIDAVLLCAGDALDIEGAEEPHAAISGIDTEIARMNATALLITRTTSSSPWANFHAAWHRTRERAICVGARSTSM